MRNLIHMSYTLTTVRVGFPDAFPRKGYYSINQHTSSARQVLRTLDACFALSRKVVKGEGIMRFWLAELTGLSLGALVKRELLVTIKL